MTDLASSWSEQLDFTAEILGLDAFERPSAGPKQVFELFVNGAQGLGQEVSWNGAEIDHSSDRSPVFLVEVELELVSQRADHIDFLTWAHS